MNNLQPQMWAPGINLSDPLAHKVLAAFPCWGGSGDAIRDVATGRLGTFVDPAETTWGTSTMGQHLEFADATPNEIAIPATGQIPWAGDCTISVWVWRNASAFARPILEQGDGSRVKWFGLGVDASDKIYVLLDDDTTRISTSFPTSIPEDEWAHILLTKSSAVAEVFLNAESDGTMAGRGDCASADDINIGKVFFGADDGPWWGKMQNMIWFDGVLTPSEIATLYADPWQLYHQPDPIELWAAATAGGAPGLSIPIAMHHYQQMAGVN